eukprot:880643-Prorocentrum_minimum.AAC.9
MAEIGRELEQRHARAVSRSCALAAHVDVGEEERKHLLAGPQRLGLEDRRGGHAPVKVLQPHHDVHEDFLRDEAVAHRHLPAPQQRVLHPRAQTSAA